MASTPILVEVHGDSKVLASSTQEQANLAHVLMNRFLRAYEHTHLDVGSHGTVSTVGPSS
jgi:hypothetical protein